MKKELIELAKEHPYKPFFSNSAFCFAAWLRDIESKGAITNDKRCELHRWCYSLEYDDRITLEKAILRANKVRSKPISQLTLSQEEEQLIKDFRDKKIIIIRNISEDSY